MPLRRVGGQPLHPIYAPVSLSSWMLRPAAQFFLHELGGLRFIRWKSRSGLRILMYHRFPKPAVLDAQCSWLSRNYHPVSMSQVAHSFDSGTPLPPYACAVTVDDGFRDFVDVAHPVFSAYRIPVTVFVVTDFLDARLWLWGDRVKYAFRHTPLQTADVGQFRFELSSVSAREKAAFELKEYLKRAAQDERAAVLQELPHVLELSIPNEPPREFQPLTWDEARRLAREDVEFGAHTRTHPILSTIGSADELKDEIAGSKRILEERLGRPAPHFCYPNGRWEDIGTTVLGIVRHSGFRTAVTTEPGLNIAGADRHLLRRIGMDCDMPLRYFQQRAAAFHL